MTEPSQPQESALHFEHQRHRQPLKLPADHELILAVPPLRSAVNLARIIRVAGCCGVSKIIACEPGRIDPKITRDALQSVELEQRRSLPPVLKKLKAIGWTLVGLEQTSHSQLIYEYLFPQKVVLVLGHERQGIADDVLQLLDITIEIPVFGQPPSYNVATATAQALYEYCRQQYPKVSE